MGNRKTDAVGEQDPQVERVPELSGQTHEDVALGGRLVQLL